MRGRCVARPPPYRGNPLFIFVSTEIVDVPFSGPSALSIRPAEPTALPSSENPTAPLPAIRPISASDSPLRPLVTAPTGKTLASPARSRRLADPLDLPILEHEVRDRVHAVGRVDDAAVPDRH